MRQRRPIRKLLGASVAGGDAGTVALDASNEAPSFSIADVNIADTAGIQEPLNASFDLRL